MAIIEADTKHVDEISVLFDLYRQFYHQPSDIAKAKEFLIERITGKESVIYFSQEENGNVSGFVQLYPLFTSVGMKRLWLLNDLFVKAEYRNKGIAKRLIDRCKKLAEETNASGLMLETSKNNHEGNFLYLKEGFDLLEESNFYFWKRSISRFGD